MSIVWKDILKPRYALVADIIPMPSLETGKPTIGYSVAVPRLPYKRDLSLKFNLFYNSLSVENPNSLVFCGSKRTLTSLYGIGSVLPHNMKNAILLKPVKEKT